MPGHLLPHTMVGISAARACRNDVTHGPTHQSKMADGSECIDDLEDLTCDITRQVEPYQFEPLVSGSARIVDDSDQESDELDDEDDHSNPPSPRREGPGPDRVDDW